MWVIYNTQTGVEFDRVEDHDEARSTITLLNFDPESTQTFGLRWED